MARHGRRHLLREMPLKCQLCKPRTTGGTCAPYKPTAAALFDRETQLLPDHLTYEYYDHATRGTTATGSPLFIRYRASRTRKPLNNISLSLTTADTQYTPPTRLNCLAASRRRRLCVGLHEFVTSSRRLPTDSIDNLETDCWDVAVWLREFWSILIIFSTMTSLCCHLSPTAQEIVNWVTTADWCVHDTTRLRCFQNCSDSSRLSPTSCGFRTHRRRDSVWQLSRVGGV